MRPKFEELLRTFCYDCKNNSFENCNHCWNEYKEKHNMNDLIVIQVKVNGKDVPLHEISEQTLLTVRENSKPKEIPVARVASLPGCGKRLILRTPYNIGDFAGKIVAIDLKRGGVCNFWAIDGEPGCQYTNIQAIS